MVSKEKLMNEYEILNYQKILAMLHLVRMKDETYQSLGPLPQNMLAVKNIWYHLYMCLLWANMIFLRVLQYQLILGFNSDLDSADF